MHDEHEYEQELEHEHENEHGHGHDTVRDTDMDTDRDRDGEIDVITPSYSHHQASFEIGIGSSFVLESPYNHPAATSAQYHMCPILCSLIPYNSCPLNQYTIGWFNTTELDFL